MIFEYHTSKNMKLPINENPSIYPYSNYGYMNAILENREILKLKILNRMSKIWNVSDNSDINLNENNITILSPLEEKNTMGMIHRACEPNDELIIKVDYYRVLDNEAYFSILIKDDKENRNNSCGYAVTNYGFYIKDKMIKYEDVNYYWFKLIRDKNQLSFFASVNGDDWDIIYKEECSWLSSAELPIIGIYYSLGNHQYNNFKYMNYIQLFLDLNDIHGRRWLDYYMLPRKEHDHIYGVFSHFIDTEYHNVDEVCSIYGSVSNFVNFSINNNYYVSMLLDEYYVPNRWAYEKEHYEHSNLIYGFNDNFYYLLGFNDKVTASELPQESLDIAYYPYKRITRYRFSINLKTLEFNLDNFIINLYEFIEGENSGLKYSNILFQRDGIFGLKIFECLLNDEKAKNLLFKDKRISYILYEHSKIMRERLDYLFEKCYISEYYRDDLINKCDNILHTSEILKNLLIKFRYIQNGESKIMLYLKELYEKEQVFYKKLYNILKIEK